MKCTKCGFDNFDNSKFCEDCGTPLSPSGPPTLYPQYTSDMRHYNTSPTVDVSSHPPIRQSIDPTNYLTSDRLKDIPPSRNFSDNVILFFIGVIVGTITEIIIFNIIPPSAIQDYLLILGPLMFVLVTARSVKNNFNDIRTLNILTHNYKDDLPSSIGLLAIIVPPIMVYMKYYQLYHHLERYHPDMPSYSFKPIQVVLVLFLPNIPLIFSIMDIGFFHIVMLIVSVIAYTYFQRIWQETLNDHIAYHKTLIS
ncbi:MAG: zinc ribbon domain-containing protein [Candidatus Heimdallarchaeota archaeon]|nr:zinc ribbon domain-containing protein [Candidatus Heimdallarchaeota archaeon]